MSDDFLSRIPDIINNVDKDMERAMKKQGSLVRDHAKDLAPVRRSGAGGGELRDNIYLKNSREGDSFIAEVYTPIDYALYVEFGTGPTGQANHQGISPSVSPVYSQSGWMIPADAMDPEDAEFYGFGPVEKDGEIIGYYTSGQIARPFMYPGLNDLRETITENLQKAFNDSIERSLK